MGEDCRSGLPWPHFDWQSHNRNSLTARLAPGKENTVAAHMASTNGTSPVYHQLLGQRHEPHGWFYCLPQFRHGFNPVTASSVRDKVPCSFYESRQEAVPTNVGAVCVDKRLLVFDQTALIHGSDSRNPMQFPTWIKQFPGAYNLNGEIPDWNSDINHPSGQILTGKLNENHGSDQVSEMHEDTEELNALLYSDDGSDYNDDDEVTSTGHSPSSITDYDKLGWFEGSTEDVASCNIPTRKRKVCDDSNPDIQALEERRDLEYEDDAESTTSPWSDETELSSENKRMRKEKVKETIDILERIIPSGKGKNAIVVLDEAIQYLTSLKRKAKALGLDTL